MQVWSTLRWTAGKQIHQRTVIDPGNMDSMDVVKAPLRLPPGLLSQALRLPFALHSKSAAVLKVEVGSNLHDTFLCCYVYTLIEGLQFQLWFVGMQMQMSHHTSYN